MSPLQALRGLALGRRQAKALERIADSLEELLILQGGQPGKGLRTYYRDKGEAEPGFLAQTNEEFALLEARERERLKKGKVVEMDEDLSDD